MYCSSNKMPYFYFLGFPEINPLNSKENYTNSHFLRPQTTRKKKKKVQNHSLFGIGSNTQLFYLEDVLKFCPHASWISNLLFICTCISKNPSYYNSFKLNLTAFLKWMCHTFKQILILIVSCDPVISEPISILWWRGNWEGNYKSSRLAIF